MSPILNLLLYIIPILMVLTHTSTQYPLLVESIIYIWTKNCLIPPTDAELMGGCRRTGEVYYSLFIKEFPHKYLILTHYMLSAW